MKLIEKMQAKMEKSDKKVESIIIALQNLDKESQAKNSEQPLPL